MLFVERHSGYLPIIYINLHLFVNGYFFQTPKWNHRTAIIRRRAGAVVVVARSSAGIVISISERRAVTTLTTAHRVAGLVRFFSLAHI
jgi:hypothetical protein